MVTTAGKECIEIAFIRDIRLSLRHKKNKKAEDKVLRRYNDIVITLYHLWQNRVQFSFPRQRRRQLTFASTLRGVVCLMKDFITVLRPTDAGIIISIWFFCTVWRKALMLGFMTWTMSWRLSFRKFLQQINNCVQNDPMQFFSIPVSEIPLPYCWVHKSMHQSDTITRLSN